jgi:hypothetical protein
MLVRAPIGVPGWGEARVEGRVDPRGVEGRVEAGGVGSLRLYRRLRRRRRRRRRRSLPRSGRRSGRRTRRRRRGSRLRRRTRPRIPLRRLSGCEVPRDSQIGRYLLPCAR